MTDREAMKMALEALEDSMYPQKKQFDAIFGLNRALAQLEQTKCPRCNEVNPAEIHTCSSQVAQAPVAYLCENAVGHKYFRWKKPTSHYKPIALYTAPPKQWVGLTIDESSALYNKNYDLYATDMPIGDFLMIQREVEAKLKEKNA